MILDWPAENAIDPTVTANRWFHASSNYCLDFHGDPISSDLVVFSDGNHHMALQQTLEQFRINEKLNSIFYCTTPPKVYLDWIASGSIEIGNLRLTRMPDIIIGPDDIMHDLVANKTVETADTFARSKGVSLLTKKGNPKKILARYQGTSEFFQRFSHGPVSRLVVFFLCLQ